MPTNDRAYDQAYRAQHLERIREQNTANQRARRARLHDAGIPTTTDRDRARSREAYAADPDRVKIKVAAWRKADLRRTFVNWANVKAKKLGVPGRLDWRTLPNLPRPCHYCGREARGFDHVIPFVEGGPNTADNLVPCCLPCNERKNRFPAERLVKDADGSHVGVVT